MTTMLECPFPQRKWFLLRRGYSPVARIGGLSLLSLSLLPVVIITNPSQLSRETAASQQALAAAPAPAVKASAPPMSADEIGDKAAKSLATSTTKAPSHVPTPTSPSPYAAGESQSHRADALDPAGR
jgi:hypothetical protein